MNFISGCERGVREDAADSCSSFSCTCAAHKYALLLLCTCAVQHYVEEFQRQFKFCRLLVFSPVFRLLPIVHVMVTCSTPSFSVICERSKTGQWEGLEAWFTCIIAWCFGCKCPGVCNLTCCLSGVGLYGWASIPGLIMIPELLKEAAHLRTVQ